MPSVTGPADKIWAQLPATQKTKGACPSENLNRAASLSNRSAPLSQMSFSEGIEKFADSMLSRLRLELLSQCFAAHWA